MKRRDQHETFDAPKNSEPVFELESLSTDENLIINDIFESSIDSHISENREHVRKEVTGNCTNKSESVERHKSENVESNTFGEDSKQDIKLEVSDDINISVDEDDFSSLCSIKQKLLRKESVEVQIFSNGGDSSSCGETDGTSYGCDTVPSVEATKKTPRDSEDSIECVSIDYNKSNVINMVNSEDSDNKNSLRIDPNFPASIKAVKRELDFGEVHELENATYHCIRCENNFPKKQDLYIHVRAMHMPLILKCYYCSLHIRDDILNKHLLEHMANLGLKDDKCSTLKRILGMCDYVCVICDRYFRLKNSFLNHVVIAHANISLWCETCNKTFANKTLYKRHLYCHEKFSCKECNTVYKSKKMLQEHLNCHMHPPKVCEICGREFLMRFQYINHMFSHGSFECEKCSKKFLTEINLLAHKHTTHAKYICNQCNLDFNTKKALERHNENQHSTSKKFLTEIKLRAHKHTTHAKYICNQCNLDFNTKKALERHNENQHSTSDYECMKCKKKFNTMVEYSLHSHV